VNLQARLTRKSPITATRRPRERSIDDKPDTGQAYLDQRPVGSGMLDVMRRNLYTGQKPMAIPMTG